MFLDSSQLTHPRLRPLCTSGLCLTLARRDLFLHAGLGIFLCRIRDKNEEVPEAHQRLSKGPCLQVQTDGRSHEHTKMHFSEPGVHKKSLKNPGVRQKALSEHL